MPRAKVRLVTDDADHEALDVQLNGRSGVDVGVIVLRPVPRAIDLRDVTPDFLLALGKSVDCLRRERRTPEAARLLEIWLRAEGVAHVVLPHADRVSVFLWQDLDKLTARLGATLWIISACPVRRNLKSGTWTTGAAPSISCWGSFRTPEVSARARRSFPFPPMTS